MWEEAILVTDCDFLTRLRAELEISLFTMKHRTKRRTVVFHGYGEGNHISIHLLSYHVGVMASLYFEGAVIGPQVNGVCYTCYASLIDLT